MRRRRWQAACRLAVLTSCTVLLVYLVNTQFNAIKYTNRRKTSFLEPMPLALDQVAYISGSDVTDPRTRHAFNVITSDHVASDRQLPDTRHHRCVDAEYQLNDYETASVIIVFYNEARSALLRTIVSVLNRTPPDLLQEIILVDDCSDDVDDGRLVSDLPKVRLIRHSTRRGLIVARNHGAEQARGDYIVFLDSHSEVNTGWLEPLMQAATKNSETIASPVIDVIDVETFQYRPTSAQLKGGFDWTLHFRWIPMQDEQKAKRLDPTESYPTPAIAGGLFLINTVWFRKLGSFDPELRIWGGESLEISLKAWMCGGRVEIIPCSRIGHVFRKRHPYSFPEGNANTYLRNTKRVADVWLDGYRQFFYEARPNARDMEAGETAQQVAVKEALKCNGFAWYLQNVFPELKLPNEDNTAFGELKQDSQCLTAGKESTLNLTECSDIDKHLWTFTLHSAEMKLGTACMSAGQEDNPYLTACSQEDDQKWSRIGRTLVHVTSGKCLESGLTSHVSLATCRHSAVSQQWDFTVELQTQDHAPLHIT